MKQELYPAIEPYQIHALAVSDLHTLYVEESGNPQGHPVIILHGGPGGQSQALSRQFFDPEFYRIIQFDQRGCGQSTPHACLEANTTQDLVADIERIRQYLAVEQWLVMGGSWGTTLALHYAIQHPSVVVGLILRGIFLGRQADIDWLYQDGASDFYPDNFEAFKAQIPLERQHELVNAYYEQLTSEDISLRQAAAKAWSDWEAGIVKLIPSPPLPWDAEEAAKAMAIARLECAYFYHHCFVEDDNYILNHVSQIQHLPCKIVHGRYDVDCRPSGAWELHKAWPQSELCLIQDAGHAQAEPGIAQTLLNFAEASKKYFA